MIFNQVIAGFEPWTSSTEAWLLSHLSSPSYPGIGATCDLEIGGKRLIIYKVKYVSLQIQALERGRVNPAAVYFGPKFSHVFVSSFFPRSLAPPTAFCISPDYLVESKD